MDKFHYFVMKFRGVSYQSVFDNYLAEIKPCAIDKKIILSEEGIRLIRNSKGVTVLAHPVYLTEEMVHELFLAP